MRDFSVPENGNRCIVYFSWWFSSYARIFHGTSNRNRKMLWSDLEVITFWELLPRLVDASSYKNSFSSPSQAKFWVFGVQSCCLWSKKYCSEHNIRVTTSKTVVFFCLGFLRNDLYLDYWNWEIILLLVILWQGWTNIEKHVKTWCWRKGSAALG